MEEMGHPGGEHRRALAEGGLFTEGRKLFQGRFGQIECNFGLSLGRVNPMSSHEIPRVSLQEDARSERKRERGGGASPANAL